MQVVFEGFRVFEAGKRLVKAVIAGSWNSEEEKEGFIVMRAEMAVRRVGWGSVVMRDFTLFEL
jgi:hypothetical protein